MYHAWKHWFKTEVNNLIYGLMMLWLSDESLGGQLPAILGM